MGDVPGGGVEILIGWSVLVSMGSRDGHSQDMLPIVHSHKDVYLMSIYIMVDTGQGRGGQGGAVRWCQAWVVPGLRWCRDRCQSSGRVGIVWSLQWWRPPCMLKWLQFHGPLYMYGGLIIMMAGHWCVPARSQWTHSNNQASWPRMKGEGASLPFPPYTLKLKVNYQMYSKTKGQQLMR